MSTDILEHTLQEISKNNVIKATAKSLEDRVALQLLNQKDNDVIVLNIPINEPDEARMNVIRRIYNWFSPLANIMSIYPGISQINIFGKKTVDKFYMYQRIKSDCLQVFYPKTTMYVIEFFHVKESHFPEGSGQTHWSYLDQFKDAHFD